MATFVSSIRFTPQGMAAIGETTKRAAAFKASAKKMGVKVTGVYWMLGNYDGLIIFEAADDETATAVTAKLCSLGNVHTSTVRALTAAEMDQVLAKMNS
jgi:uncharacterized protein with GYD domain